MTGVPVKVLGMKEMKGIFAGAEMSGGGGGRKGQLVHKLLENSY